MKIIIAIIAGIATLIGGGYFLTSLHKTDDDIDELGYVPSNHVNKIAVTISAVIMIAGIFTLIILFQNHFHL